MSSPKAALLWDESFYWALILIRALNRNGLAYKIVTASDIRAGALRDHAALVVPGGWASNKMKALGDKGATAIRKFIGSGGSYFGICGGAGLATTDGLGLLQINRRPLRERTPSLSGPVMLNLTPHPIWEGIDSPRFHIWWPSQFVPADNSIRVLGVFESHTQATFSSDLCAGDMQETGWTDVERAYGINLDPSRMKGDPLVVEGAYGDGRVVASLVHPDTPYDQSGTHMLQNVWKHLGLDYCMIRPETARPASGPLQDLAEGLMRFGRRNFLWYDRPPLIQWRRGIRGIEYFTLHAMIRELPDGALPDGLAGEVASFVADAKRLLLHERMALQRGEPLSFAATADPQLKALRSSLFAESKSYGGRFKSILDKIDARVLEGFRNDA